jgi:hypothetical protein
MGGDGMNDSISKRGERMQRVVSTVCEALQSWAMAFSDPDGLEYANLYDFKQAVLLLQEEFDAFDDAARAYLCGMTVEEYRASQKAIIESINRGYGHDEPEEG